MAYPNEPEKLPLEYPVTVNKREIKALNVRRPKVRDNLIAAKKDDDADREMAMMSLLTGEDEDVLHELDMFDFEALQKVVMGFRKKGNSKSEKSSEAL